MPIYKYSVPGSNYYGDGVFYQDYYFEKDFCPTQKEVINFLENEINKIIASDNLEDISITLPHLKEHLFAVQNCDTFPRVMASLIMTNSFVTLPKFGKQPISVTLIRPHKIEK